MINYLNIKLNEDDTAILPINKKLFKTDNINMLSKEKAKIFTLLLQNIYFYAKDKVQTSNLKLQYCAAE